MKIIDLLNIWVEDRNKLPKKIKIDNEIFEYDEGCNLYKNPNAECYLIQNYLNCIERLNKEVEVIEEKKEIEELTDDDIYDFNHVALKVNELVKAVNKLNKEREEK